MEREKLIVGFLILLITSSVVYITLQGEGVRIRVDNDKTTLYVFEDSRWKVGGREYNKLFEGTHKLYRDVRNVKIYTIINNTSNTTTIIRETPYKRGPFIRDTYYFKGNITDKKLFPIYHKVEIYNASGLFYRYEVRDLTYLGPTYKLKGETYLRFGRNVVVKLHPNYRWTWVYKSGIVKAQYDIKSDYEVFYVRLFDPTSFSITLNSPPNQTITKDVTPSFNFTVSGTEANYSCELFINDMGYGVPTVGEGCLAGYEHSNDILYSNDSEKYTSSDTYVKLLSINLTDLNTNDVNITVQYKYRSNSEIDSSEFRVYRNGNPVGTEKSTKSISYLTWTENLTFKKGDTVLISSYASEREIYDSLKSYQETGINIIRIYGE